MIAVKRMFLYSLIGIELVVIAYCSFYNEHGIRAILRLRQENLFLLQEIQGIQDEIRATAQDIQDWKLYPFYQEQYARDYLQMAREQDEIYLL